MLIPLYWRYTVTVHDKPADHKRPFHVEAKKQQPDSQEAARAPQPTTEAIVDKPIEPAAFEGMSRMLDPVLVTEVEQPSQAESRAASFYNYVREHIESLQKHLKQGEELFVYVHTGFEIIRVMNMAMPDWHMVVLTGLDVDDNPAQLITNLRNVQFVCKIVKVSKEHRANPIGFKSPPTAPNPM